MHEFGSNSETFGVQRLFLKLMFWKKFFYGYRVEPKAVAPQSEVLVKVFNLPQGHLLQSSGSRWRYETTFEQLIPLDLFAEISYTI